MMKHSLTTRRILSIDAFRGITILVMIFVNELAGVREIPGWLKHMPADEDAMSFVDVVFPAFLFIAGMSIPFALHKRLLKKPGLLNLTMHVLGRTAGLLCLGFFMVNAESSGSHAQMPISIYSWALLFYFCAILIWNVYPPSVKAWIPRGLGIAGLILLALIYRGGQSGNELMSPKWWGILGLIGWAYLFSCFFFGMMRGSIPGLFCVLVLCTMLFVLTKYFNWNDFPAKNATHISLMLCGVITSLLLFDEVRVIPERRRILHVILFGAGLFGAGFMLRFHYPLSKIHASPSWGFYCSAICCLLYLFLYWIIDRKGIRRWTDFFRPAAANPLLTYLIPDIIFMGSALLGIHLLPAKWNHGLPGLLWSAVFAVLVMYIVRGLNKLRIRLQL
jgi:heparan-alpha-glucosaminide N-acetyltransferase